MPQETEQLASESLDQQDWCPDGLRSCGGDYASISGLILTLVLLIIGYIRLNKVQSAADQARNTVKQAMLAYNRQLVLLKLKEANGLLDEMRGYCEHSVWPMASDRCARLNSVLLSINTSGLLQESEEEDFYSGTRALKALYRRLREICEGQQAGLESAHINLLLETSEHISNMERRVLQTTEEPDNA